MANQVASKRRSHQWVNHVWYGQSKLAYLLLPLSALFYLLSNLRRCFYSCIPMLRTKYPAPVIVVGNITVGGTGKTPMVVSLMLELEKMGFTPGAASRGHRRATTETTLLDDTHTARQVGDEPLLIYRNTQGIVLVGSNRIDVINRLIHDHGCDVVICDDGLQDYRFDHDIEIVMIDGDRIFGNHYLLPAGPLRESIQRLQKAHFVVCTSRPVPAVSNDWMKLHLNECVQLNNQEDRQSLADWKGQQVHAIAGIGNPSRFFNGLRSLGLKVIEHHFPDHASYELSDLSFNDQNPILMTEKDAVKCRQFKIDNAWYIPVETELPDGFSQRVHSILRNFNG